MTLLAQLRQLSPSAIATRAGVQLSEVLHYGCTGVELPEYRMTLLANVLAEHESGAVVIPAASKRAYATADEVRDILRQVGVDGAKEIFNMRPGTYASYFHDDQLSYSKLLRVKSTYLDYLRDTKADERIAPMPTPVNKQLVKTRAALVKISELVARLTAELNVHLPASSDNDANA